MLLAGRAAIVTGASSGIGRATALVFAREGAAVLAVGRDRQALDRVAGAARGSDGPVRPAVADVTAPQAPDRLVATAMNAFGRLDILVNAAGIIAVGSIETTSDADWDRVLDVNLRAPFRLMRVALPELAARHGTVVNVSSVTGLRSFADILAYAVSKSGLDQLTRCAALEVASKGVRVNAVCPGMTVTNLHRRAGMDERAYAAFLERARETHPLGRPGEPDEIAELILFLASDRAGWITGETIAIDGGRHLTCAR
jgi:NAD(P)-dependent dehydrogenase (short-subunit alcohol dehydrogenase family)